MLPSFVLEQPVSASPPALCLSGLSAQCVSTKLAVIVRWGVTHPALTLDISVHALNYQSSRVCLNNWLFLSLSRALSLYLVLSLSLSCSLSLSRALSLSCSLVLALSLARSRSLPPHTHIITQSPASTHTRTLSPSFQVHFLSLSVD